MPKVSDQNAIFFDIQLFKKGADMSITRMIEKKLIPTRCPGCKGIAMLDTVERTITCNECKETFVSVIAPCCERCGKTMEKGTYYYCETCNVTFKHAREVQMEEFITRVSLLTKVIEKFQRMAIRKGAKNYAEIVNNNVNLHELLMATRAFATENKYTAYTDEWFSFFQFLRKSDDLITFNHFPRSLTEIRAITDPSEIKVMIIPKPNVKVEDLIKKRLRWVKEKYLDRARRMNLALKNTQNTRINGIIKKRISNPPNPRITRLQDVKKKKVKIINPAWKPEREVKEEAVDTFEDVDLLDFGKEKIQCVRMFHVMEAVESFKRNEIPNDIHIIADLIDGNSELCNACGYKCKEKDDADDEKPDLVPDFVKAGKKYRKEYYDLLKESLGGVERKVSRDDLVDNLIVNFINLIADELELEGRTDIDAIR